MNQDKRRTVSEADGAVERDLAQTKGSFRQWLHAALITGKTIQVKRLEKEGPLPE